MNQQKTGEFLKHLRKQSGLTQEQLAEHFYVSSRTISRWETGSNMPDVDMLIDLADFYDVDIREIIDGERKSENMDNGAKETLKKVAEYATEEQKMLRKKVSNTLLGLCAAMLTCVLLFSRETKGLLNGIVPENVCAVIMGIVLTLAIAMLVFEYFFYGGKLDKFIQQRIKSRESKR